MEPGENVFEDFDSYKVSILTRIKWKLEDIRYIPKHIREGVAKLIYWFPIIWKDKDWDHSYIYTILEHKLKAQAKYIGSRDIHTLAQRDAEKMMTCVRLLEKDKDGFYECEYLDYFNHKRWYKSPPSGEEDGKFDEYFAKYPLIYKRVLNGEGPYDIKGQYLNKQFIAMNIAEINQDRAHKLSFKIMEQNIKGWWD